MAQRCLFAVGLLFTLLATGCGGGTPPPVPIDQQILYTNAISPGPPSPGTDWAKNACQGNAYLSNTSHPSVPPWEWTPLLHPTQQYDGPLVSISGNMVEPRISGVNPNDAGDVTEDFSGNANRFNVNADVPFTHPFGTDWDGWIAPDPQYLPLLAPSATDPHVTDSEYVKGLAQAKADGYSTPGLLGMETDRRLFPPAYRPGEKNRIVAFGRWIADCGHDNPFLSEIHPPLLVASGGSLGNATTVRVISRPFLVGQDFLVGNQDDGATFDHFSHEILKVTGHDIHTSFCYLGFPCSSRIEAHPQIFTTPFSDFQTMVFYVRPPTARQSPNQILQVSAHFTLRSGVTVSMMPFGNDQLQVIVQMNADKYKPAQLPHRYDRNVNLNDFDTVHALKLTTIFKGYPPPDPTVGGELYVDQVLARGILTDSYDPPLAQSPLDTQNVITNVPIDNVSNSHFTSVDDTPTQAFPIYGSLTLQWKTTTVKITSPADQSSFGQSSIGSRQTNPITFTASASDFADIPLTGTALKWTYDGSPLGTGESFSTTLKADPCGISPHKVTVTATDSAGHSASDTITLFIGNIC